MRLLVIDDDILLRELLVSILRLEWKDWSFFLAADGIEAMQVLESDRHIDFCILDVQMPRCNGITLAHRMKNSVLLKTIPILMVTSVAEREVIKEAASLGVSGYILKPYNANQLIETVRRITDKILPRVEDPHVVMKRLQLSPEGYMEKLDLLCRDMGVNYRELKQCLLNGRIREAQHYLSHMETGCSMLGFNHLAYLMREVGKCKTLEDIIQEYGILDTYINEIKNYRDEAVEKLAQNTASTA